MRDFKLESIFKGKKQPAIMGIINCTPDSFSDGGLYLERDKALEHAGKLIAEGADILDIGGESTRPFSKGVSLEEEAERVIPLIREIRKISDIPISVDTQKAELAEKALMAGADIINDITALSDLKMLDLCSESGAAIVLMHMQGKPQTMQIAPKYQDLIKEIYDFLEERVNLALKKNIAAESIIIDPGLGFGKDFKDNFKILAFLERFKELGCRLMIGSSRKSFIRKLVATKDKEAEANGLEVLAGTLSTGIIAAQAKVDILRVHDVAPTKASLDILSAVKAEKPA